MNTIWMARLQGSGNAAFDGNREITREGLPAVTPGGETVGETLENFLYPKYEPTISLNVEGGESIKQYNDPDLTVDLYWEVVHRGIDIDFIVIDESDNLDDGSHQSQGAIFVGELSANEDKTFIAQVGDIDGSVRQAQARIEFKRALWFGALSVAPEHLLENLNASMDSLGFSKVLTNATSFNRDYDCTGGKYIYVAFPSEYGNPVEVKTGDFDFSDFEVAEIQAMDHFGNRMSYKLLYSGYQTGDDININIVRIEQEIS